MKRAPKDRRGAKRKHRNGGFCDPGILKSLKNEAHRYRRANGKYQLLKYLAGDEDAIHPIKNIEAVDIWSVV